jgi:hypothetical protein
LKDDAGEKPSMAVIKRRWNMHRKAEPQWTCDVTKCASGQAITLGIRQVLPRLQEPSQAAACPLSAVREETSQSGPRKRMDQSDLAQDAVQIA